MDDLISRQQAIDAVNEWLRLYAINRTMSNVTSLQDVLRQLPSAQPYTEEQIQKMQDMEQAQLEEAYRLGRESAQQWIPCSEQLPEPEAKIYLVCTDTGYQCQCRWTNINHFWTDLTTDWHWHIMDVPQYSKVAAWMSLPEPYKAERREE